MVLNLIVNRDKIKETYLSASDTDFKILFSSSDWHRMYKKAIFLLEDNSYIVEGLENNHTYPLPEACVGNEFFVYIVGEMANEFKSTEKLLIRVMGGGSGDSSEEEYTSKQLYENILANKEQIDKKADKEHTHNYARSSSPGGDAENALKVNGHTVQSDVPVNAKFTDSIYTHPTSSGYKHVPSGGSTNQILRYNGDGTAKWDTDYVGSGRKAGTLIGGNSTTEGSNNTASGDNSHAEGDGNISSGRCSHVECYRNTASGNYSHAGGAESFALGESSFVHGYAVRANKFETAFGKFNNLKSTDVNNEDVALQVGNGYWSVSGGVYQNILTFYYDGAFYINGTYYSSGADYAEYFEWLDGNADNEDRRGYFVTMDGDKIKKANAGDYILGIVSGNPSVIGNADEEWTGRLVLDEFGSPVIKEIEIVRKMPTNIEQEGIEFDEVVEHLIVPEENTEYDPEREYTHRADRPEWDAVGMLGVLSVRDDGTCEENGYCKCSENGIATKAEEGYRVIKRINNNIVKVILK